MAGSWIKMRASLRDKPEVIRIARQLAKNIAFRNWFNGNAANPWRDEVLRYVTCCALLLVWSNARENGKFVGDDLLIEGFEIDDLDEMACPGLGAAMRDVGWAKQHKDGVILPRFKAYNVPIDGAERQKRYRERRDGALRDSNGASVTNALPEQEREQTREQEINPEASKQETSAAGISLAARPPAQEVVTIMRKLWPRNHEKAYRIAQHPNASIERACWMADRIIREKPARAAGFMEKAITEGWDVPPEWVVRFHKARGDTNGTLRIAGGAA